MSVLIKGMEMPTSCQGCRFCNGQADTEYGVCAWCDVDGKARDAYTMQDCPLVPVPPHGDLIERDAIKFDWDEDNQTWGYDIYSAPTIIPASEEGE